MRRRWLYLFSEQAAAATARRRQRAAEARKRSRHERRLLLLRGRQKRLVLRLRLGRRGANRETAAAGCRGNGEAAASRAVACKVQNKTKYKRELLEVQSNGSAQTTPQSMTLCATNTVVWGVRIPLSSKHRLHSRISKRLTSDPVARF